jgi:hypothetical protein
MMVLVTFDNQGLRSEVTSFMAPDELMTVASFVDYVCREQIGQRIWQCSSDDGVLQLKGIVEYARHQEQSRIFPVHANLLLKHVYDPSYCFVFSNSSTTTGDEPQVVKVEQQEKGGLLVKKEEGSQKEEGQRVKERRQVKVEEEPVGIVGSKVDEASKPATKSGGFICLLDDSDTEENQNPLVAALGSRKQTNEPTPKLPMPSTRAQSPTDKRDKVNYRNVIVEDETICLPYDDDDIEENQKPQAVVGRKRRVQATSSSAKRKPDDHNAIEKNQKPQAAVGRKRRVQDTSSAKRKQKLPRHPRAQESNMRSQTNRAKDATSVGGDGPPPPPPPPQVGNQYFLLWKDRIEYEVGIVKVLTPEQVTIKFSGYNGMRNISVNQLLPYTPKRKEAFEDAIKIRVFKQRQAREKQELQRKQVREKRLKEQLQRGARAKRQEQERTRKFGRFRLRRDDVPKKHGLPGQTVRLSSDRVVYYAKEDETPAKIARCFKVDIECLLYDNEVAYPGIAAHKKLYDLTCIVMTRIVMNA